MSLLLPSSGFARDRGEEAAAPRVSEVTEWTEAPEALAASYRRSRIVQSSISIGTGTLAVIGGTLVLTGVAELEQADNAVLGALLFTGGASSVTVGTLGLMNPLTDGELQAERLSASEDEARIEAWVRQRQVVARRGRIARAIGLGATAAGLALSAALVEDPNAADTVAGFEAIAGEDANLNDTRRTLLLIAAGTAGFALFTGLRRGPEDRIIRQIEEQEPLMPDRLELTLRPAGLGGALQLRW